MKNKKLCRLNPKVFVQTDFYVFDTETGKKNKDGSIQWHLNAKPESFIFGVIYGHNYTKVIYSIKEFKETLLEPRFKKKKVFAHNAEYDLSVLYDNIYSFDPEAIFNGKFITATNGNCIFADSMNIFVGLSVKKLGKLIGIEKPDLGDENLFSKNGVTENEINRCIQDCVIVWEGLIRMFDFAGDIKITQAGLSMTYFRRHHLPYEIEHNENTKYFWDSYFGGRCEAFKIGKTNSQVIDVNSMYPDRMKKISFPNPKNLRVEFPPTSLFLSRILPNYEGCIYCEVEHKETRFGFLPLKKDGKLLFPIGRFSGCWNFNEIKFALDNKVIKIIKIFKVVYSDRMQSIFEGFVDELFRLKLLAEISGNDFERDRSKRYANSLYGKFAQRIEEKFYYLDDMNKKSYIIKEMQDNKRLIRIEIFNTVRVDCFLVLRNDKNFNLSYSIPSFASYITSASRVLLLSKMIELENNKVTYCDTDSIFYEIDTPIKTGSGLGEWKKEKKIVTEINGLKNYKFLDEFNKEYHRLKGVPSKAIKNKDGSFSYQNLVKTKEGLRRNIDNGVLIDRKKVISNKYDKRVVLKTGETKPIKL